MNPNEAPIDVLHKSRLLSIVLGMGFVSCLWLAATIPINKQLRYMLFLGAGLFLLYFLFFEIQTIEIFRTYLSINYICRKVLVEHRDIDNVSIQQTTRRGVRAKYIILRLRNGRKTTLGNLRESAEVVYAKLKACESTKEEFLQGDNH